MRNQLKIIIILVGILLLVGLGFSIANRGKTSLILKVVPADSQILVDGVPIPTGRVKLKNGIHKFIAKRPPLTDYEVTIDTSKQPNNSTLTLLPTADTKEALDWLANNPEIQKQRESAGGEQANEVQKFINKKYPIISKLPIENDHYKIDYSIDKNYGITLSVDLFAIINKPSQYDSYIEQLKQYQTEALDFIYGNGIKKGDVVITFTPNPNQ